MPAQQTSLTLPTHAHQSPVLFTRSPLTADPSITTWQSITLYALVAAGILAVFLILGLLLWGLCNHHYRTMIAALQNGRDHAAACDRSDYGTLDGHGRDDLEQGTDGKAH
ncbi:MAG: hypothetical protein Q9200_006867, partial [Gallowayella weberi]